MTAAKSAIIDQLRKDILPLEGYRTSLGNPAIDIGLGPIKNAFPGKQFPLGAIHEFITNSAENTAATSGFIAGLLSTLMKKGGIALWIGNGKKIFPPALKTFGIAPDKIVFVSLKKEKELLWTIEEALKCEGLAAVVGVIPELNFTNSRRLQLAVEQSKVTGFIIRHNPKNIIASSFVARWHITTLPGEVMSNLPGVGFPAWHVSLIKVRNGKPGDWPVVFAGGKFKHHNRLIFLPENLQIKTG